MKTYEELADDKIKEMFQMGYCVGGNYEGIKEVTIKLSDKAQRELEDLKKELNLPEVAKTMRV